MFKAKRAQPVHKTGLMHLPALGGDDMHKLHDTKSEFSKNIKTYNMAINASMNRDLSQALRDVNTTIETLNRSQQATYKTMCRIINTQRRRVKETYQHYQQSLRDGGGKTSKRPPSSRFQNKQKKPIQGQKLPPLEAKTDSQVATASQKDSTGNIAGETIKSTNNITGQVIESIDKANEPPIQSTNGYNVQSKILTESAFEPAKVDVQSVEAASRNTDSANSSKQNVLTESADDTNQPDKELAGSRETVAIECSPPKPSLSFPCRASTKKAFFTASLRPTLPPINETIGNDTLGANSGKQENGKLNERKYLQLDSLGFTKCPYAGSSKGGSSVGRVSDSPDGSVNDTVISAQKATSLRARIADLERQHMEEFLKKQNLDTKLKPYEISIDNSATPSLASSKETESSQMGSDAKSNRSIAAERRRLAKLRVAHRKAVLNSENNYQYVQLTDGTFLQGATAYKRKRFLPPSNRAQYEREQILKSEAAKTEVSVEKIGAFFNKLNLPLPTPVIKKSLQRKESKAILDLVDIKPVVIEPIKREKSIKPLTEVAKDVAYIRQYIRPSDRAEYVPSNTSWAQRY